VDQLQIYEEGDWYNMIILTNCNFANTNKPLISAPAFNFAGDTLALQISGAKGVYHLE
jgi:hypothetical protein